MHAWILFHESWILHTLSHYTSYSLFYFIICFLFHSHHIYIYTLSCYVSSFLLLLCYFYFIIFYFSCTFHWADLSWLTFHYWLYPVWLCMWQIIKNLEPWTLRTYLWVTNQLSADICSNRDIFIFMALPLVDIYILVDTEYLISCLFF